MKFSIIAFLPAAMAVALPADLARRDFPETWCACIAPGTNYPDQYSTTLCYFEAGGLRGERGFPGFWCTGTQNAPLNVVFTDAYCSNSTPGLHAVCKECSGVTNTGDCIPAK